MKKLHLISNAHLDPVWQWQWQEGAAAAISTFRVAADLCEKFDDYVFCHNEALLYMWTKEYEPQLFERIRKLVKAGRWAIIGGWFLQPDCNMPSGEAMARQILYGQTFFEREFGVSPTTAVSFDAFGHSKGLVQILQKAGYDSYLFMRPDESWLHLPAQDFYWKGFAGSTVVAHRLNTGYNTPLGHAREHIEAYTKEAADSEIALRCWGVGDHGGGPSHKDVADLHEMIADFKGKVEIIHSTPEAFFKEAVPCMVAGEFSDSLVPIFTGCYTSMSRIKRGYRMLENRLFAAEKAASAAAINGLMEYPEAELNQVQYDMLFTQFHDILPGTVVQPSETDCLHMIGHGMEIADRVYTRAFFALSAGQPVAKEGEIPLLVYNPHPYPVSDIFECEFMLADQNWKQEFTSVRIRQNGAYIPAQVEKEDGNLPLDWRKRVAFQATLAPMSMNRFDCELYTLPERPKHEALFGEDDILLDNGKTSVRIGRKSGLIESYCVNGQELLSAPAGQLAVYSDNEDPWRMDPDLPHNLEGVFTLMTPERAAKFAAVARDTLAPVRVIENGDARICVEALMEYKESTARVVYKLPKHSGEVELDITVYFLEKDKLLRCEVPCAIHEPRYLGQTMFGVNTLLPGEREQVAHKWIAASGSDYTLSLINDGVYGSVMTNGVLRQDLLRTAAYTAHPLPGRVTMQSDRFSLRIDQGERQYKLWLFGAPTNGATETIDALAQQKAEAPRVLCLFPCGDGELPQIPLQVEAARVDAFKRAEDKDGYILRLFNPSETSATAHIVSPLLQIDHSVLLESYEIGTYRLKQGKIEAVSILEK